MAVNYKEFSATVTRDFHYRFVCEHCEKTTNWIKATVYGTGRCQVPVTVAHLTAQQVPDLNKQAAEKLNEGYEKVKQLAKSGSYSEINDVAMESNEKGSAYHDYSGRDVGFPVNCPSCGKTQSWQTGNYYAFILVPPVLLAFIVSFLWFILTGQLASYSLGQFFEVVPSKVWLLGSAIGLAAGVIWYLYKKKKATNGKTRNKPEFRWN